MRLTKEQMEKYGQMMAEACESPEGLRALAAAIAPPIEVAIESREIASLLFTRDDLPVGERAVYQKPDKAVTAYWVSIDGDARRIEVGKEDIEIPTQRVHTNPMVDVSTLKHGNIGRLSDMQKSCADAITKQLNRRAVGVLSAAVPVANTVTITGGKLTDTGLNQAISILEDKGLTARVITMRGGRFNDVRGFTLDEQTKTELRQKGVIKNWGTANILLSSECNLAEVLIIPEDEIGKYPVREKLLVEPISVPTEFKTGWLAWTEVGFAVTRPDLCVKIAITS